MSAEEALLTRARVRLLTVTKTLPIVARKSEEVARTISERPLRRTHRGGGLVSSLVETCSVEHFVPLCVRVAETTVFTPRCFLSYPIDDDLCPETIFRNGILKKNRLFVVRTFLPKKYPFFRLTTTAIVVYFVHRNRSSFSYNAERSNLNSYISITLLNAAILLSTDRVDFTKLRKKDIQ